MKLFGEIDYESLRRWLSQPTYRITGVDYEVLEERLAHGSFGAAEYKWAIDLVIHYRLDGLAAGVFVATLPKPSASRGLAAAAISWME